MSCLALLAVLPGAACSGGGQAVPSPTAPTTATPLPPAPTQITMTVDAFKPAAATAQFVSPILGTKSRLGLRVGLTTNTGTVSGKLSCAVRVDSSILWSSTVDSDASARPAAPVTEHYLRLTSRYDSPALGGMVNCAFTPSAETSSLPPMSRETMFRLAEHTVPLREPCTPGPTRMCVLAGRFEMTLQWSGPAPETRGNGLVISSFFDGGGFKLVLPNEQPVTTNMQDAFVRMFDRCATSSRFELEASAAAGLSQKLVLQLRDMRTGVVQRFNHEFSDPIARRFILEALQCEAP